VPVERTATMVRAAVTWLVAALSAGSAAGPAFAQDRPVTLTVGGAVVGPLSDSADRFRTGLGGTIGVTWHPTAQAGVRLDYVWSRLGVQGDWPTVPLAVPLNVRPRIQFLTVAFAFQAPPARIQPYLVTGIGVYRRSVTISSAGGGTVSVCDPWWLVCHAQDVTVDRVIGSRATTDLGVNVGMGFRAGKFFAEIRYHFTWGPEFTTASGRERATGKFLPLTLGVMF